MAYEVLARKWRPGQFQDVVGQDHVTRTLQNAIRAKRIAHAYLFVGPRGIGKTSLARIFAKSLNCVEGPTVTPCDKCDSCIEIGKGSNLDVMEIDGASNNGVEQVRELRDTVKYAPVKGRFKIFIIDEVHMLSQAAFNALLKTLEEPPAHVKFFFATTEPEKLLPTIISRCQRYDLRRIPTPRIADRLREIVKDEKVKVDEDALMAIARGSDGGLRDAESALDQLIAFCGTTIKEADVLTVFGLTSREMLERLVKSILKGDIPALIDQAAELDSVGKDFQRLLVDLLRVFRDILVCLCVSSPGENLELTSGSIEWLSEMARGTDGERVLRIVTMLMEGEDKMRYSLSRRTLFEMLMVRCARAATVVSLDEIVRQVQEMRAGNPLPEPPPRAQASAPATAVEKGRGQDHAAPRAEPAAKESAAGPAAGGDELGRLTGDWRGVVERAARISLQVRAGLTDARPVAIEGDLVRVAVDSEFAAEMKVLEQPRNRKAVEHAMGSVLGRAVQIELVSGDLAATARKPAEKAPSTAVPGTEKSSGKQGGGKASGKSPQEWVKDPTVKKVLDTFGGGIVEVR